MNLPTPSSGRPALRSLQAVAFNQLPQLIGSVLFITLVPRRLGAEVYGQLAVCFTLIVLTQSLGELGYQEICARFVPEVRERTGDAGVGRLFHALWTVKAVVGFGLGLAAALAARPLAGWLTPLQAALIGLSVSGRIWSMTAFPLLLGLGQTWRWSFEATWRQMVITGLIVLLAPGPALTPALAALTAHEFFFAAVGWYWVRQYIPRPASSVASRTTVDTGLGTVDLLRFGLGFSLANLVLVLLLRLGPLLIQLLTRQPAQAGFFDLALGAWLFIYALFERAALALVPVLTELRLAGRGAETEQWAGGFVRYAALAAVPAAGGLWAVARPLTPLVFGAAFAPAADALRAMGFALWFLPVSWAAVMLSTLEKQPAHKVRAALLGLLVFMGGAAALRGLGAPGVALAFAAALAAYALGFGPLTGRVLRAGGARLGIVLGLGAVYIPLLHPASAALSAPQLLLAWAALTGVYLLWVTWLRAADFAAVWRFATAALRGP